MGIPLDKNGSWDLENATYRQIRDEYAGLVLQAFVEKGGEGLRTELWSLMSTTLEWRKAQDNKKK